MAAGDLVVDDLQLELSGLLMGKATNFHLDRRRGAVSGLFDTTAKMAETDFAHVAGSFAADAYPAARTATAALLVTGDTMAAVGDRIEALLAAWAPSSTDLEMWFQWPGFGKRYVIGRPLGVVADYSEPLLRRVPAFCTFRITDPTIYTP